MKRAVNAIDAGLCVGSCFPEIIDRWGIGIGYIQVFLQALKKTGSVIMMNKIYFFIALYFIWQITDQY